jgi:hypothetical protein
MRRIVRWLLVVIGMYFGWKGFGLLGAVFGAQLMGSVLLFVKMINSLGED